MEHSVSRSFAGYLRPFVEIRPGERMKTLLMLLYFLLTISTLYILKPVRGALFLNEFGAENLRYVYMGEGVFLVFVVSAYAQFSRRVSRKLLYGGVLTFFITNLVIFWSCAKIKTPYLSAVFYIWQSSFSAMITTQFWILANDIFNAVEAKRLFGLIIGGGSLGGILGGLLTSQAVRWIKTEDLFLVTAVILVLCLILVRRLWRYVTCDEVSLSASGSSKESTQAVEGAHHSILKIFKDSTYLKMLAALVVISKVSSTIIDNQFNSVVEASISGKEAMTSFLGGFWAFLNAASLFMQLFMTGFCLRYLGVGYSIWILPVGLTVFSLASVFYPILLVGILFKLFDGSLNYSVQQASREVLYLPLPSALRRRVKPVIDMLGYRAAKSVAGVYIALLAPLLKIPDHKLGLLVLLLVPVWGILVWQMKKAYSKLLHSHLLSKHQYQKATMQYRATDVLSFLYDEKSFKTIESFMTHHSSYARKLAATAYLVYERAGRDLKIARRVVNQMAHLEAVEKVYEAKADNDRDTEVIQFWQELVSNGQGDEVVPEKSVENYLIHQGDEVLDRLGKVLQDPQKGLDEKRKAVRIREAIPKQRVVDLLLDTLTVARDHAMRFVILKALIRLFHKNPQLVFSRPLLKNELSRETTIYKNIQQLRYVYHRETNTRPEEAYLGVALKAIRDESLERIFHYLSLLYPRGNVPMIYDLFVHCQEGDPRRVYAVELLTNTLDPDILILIQWILEDKECLRVEDDQVLDMLKGFVQSEDRWFSLTSRYLIVELQLDKRWPELVRLQGASDLQEVF
ncbi:MAG: hypothetical protein NC930_09545 [Candidatus Omnitrophica bacterium]|nr:hypothetical protein [Candidatus Omnitrophota bacterium]